MRVRASRPSFWVGQTYDTWNGQSWTESSPTSRPAVVKLDTGSPFEIPLGPDQQAGPSNGDTDLQTFYLAQSGPNLVFHADNAERVYIQSRSLYLTKDGAIISSTSMGSGTIYTVVSADSTATAARNCGPTPRPVGRRPDGSKPLSPDQTHRYPSSPIPTRGWRHSPAGSPPPPAPPATPTPAYDKVEAIEAMDGDHMRVHHRHPAAAPRRRRGDQFLFGNRLGFCEQISTATVVMLRSLGIPAREAVGYVPGPYNPITDLYDVQAKDAHAWVQVWFPGYGWQSFDPTADVPLANPSPGSGAGPQRRAAPSPTSRGSRSASSPALARRLRRGPPASAPAPAHLGPPDRRRPRAGRGPRWAADGAWSTRPLTAYGQTAGRPATRATATA